MEAVSVVIIAKNEARHITDCVTSARLVSDDIVLVDSGSTDGTIELAQNAGARVIDINWKGFGYARNIGAAAAANDWILAIDADERVTYQLAASVKKIQSPGLKTMYGFKRQNYFLGKKIRFGEWGRDKVYRLYNRRQIAWDLVPIHEELGGNGAVKELITGAVDHYPVVNEAQNREKTIRYATLNSKKFFQQGRKATFEKRYLSPVFNFIQSYILYLGFLDGRQGLTIAKTTSYYSWLKYKLLHELNHAKK